MSDTLTFHAFKQCHLNPIANLKALGGRRFWAASANQSCNCPARLSKAQVANRSSRQSKGSTLLSINVDSCSASNSSRSVGAWRLNLASCVADKLTVKVAGACLILLLSSSAVAGTLSPVEIYKRCYIRMTRQIPKASDTQLIAVGNASLDPLTACMALFDRAAFDSSGIMVNRTDADARKIVKTFNDFSQSYFQNKVQANPALLILRDWEEPGLYITRATFQAGVRFDSIVTLNQGLQGTRDIIGTAPPTKWQAQNIFYYYPGGPLKTSTDLNITYNPIHASGTKPVDDAATTLTFSSAVLPDFGQLVGARQSNPIPLPGYAGGVPTAAYRNGSPGTPGGAELTYLAAGPFDINSHFGPTGILGSQVFFTNNSAATSNGLVGFSDLFDGLQRRVTRMIEEDLMCHQLPTLLPTDAAVLEDLTKFNNDTYPFHKSVACLQCHSSIDPAAYAYRNFYSSSTSSAGPGISAPFVSRLPVVPGSNYVSMQAANHDNYSRLVYRSNVAHVYNSTPVASLEDLAQAVAVSDDLYSCAAKKYYRFFTGVDVDLTQSAVPGSVAAYHQNLVLKFGRNFKTNQSVRSLINAILSSTPFRTRDYQTSGAN